VERDDLFKRFPPLGAISADLIPNCWARGPDDRVLQVHFVQRQAPDGPRLLELLRQAQAHPPDELLEVLELEGETAVVTRALPAGVGFLEWLQGAGDSAPEPPKPMAGSGEGPPADPGELDYSAFFRVPRQEAGERMPEPPEPPEEPPEESEKVAPAPPGPVDRGSEYTAFFEMPVPNESPKEATRPSAPERPIPAPPPPPEVSRVEPPRLPQEAPPPPTEAPRVQPPRLPQEGTTPQDPREPKGFGYTKEFGAARGQLDAGGRSPPMKPPPGPARIPVEPGPVANEPDSITVEFRKARTIPPQEQTPSNARGWQPPPGGRSPQAPPLRDYLQRLDQSGEAMSPGRPSPQDPPSWKMAPPAFHQPSMPSTSEATMMAPLHPPQETAGAQGRGGAPPEKPGEGKGGAGGTRTRDVVILVAVVGVVVVVVVATVVILLVRGG
jgi:hypothetical protein